MEPSFRELECFIAVAEELSFTRAAKRLRLAQPPLSRHIRVLEEKIGAVLFLRGQGGVSLTAAGSLFYEDTRNIPRRLARAADAARRHASGETARLRLGFVSAVMNEELAAVMRRFRAARPGVRILLHDMPPQDQLVALAEGRLDAGFIGLLPDQPAAGLRFVRWRQEPLVCVVAEDHAMAGQRHLSLAKLAGESFIAVSAASAPAFAAHVRKLCQDAGFRPRVILESPRAQAVALMVAAGSGMALLPAAAARLAGPSVRAIPLRPAQKITHVLACRHRKNEEVVEDFLKLLA